MSSLERGVRSFSMARIRKDLGLLLAQGAQTVKFVDRTFNYDAVRANAIWEFILAENRASRFHFEIAADLLTDENFRVLRRVPPGMFRFEIGVQSGDEQTLARVGRRSELERLFANVRRLREETKVIVHLDLVAGLPGEDYPGFLDTLQRLFDVLNSDGRWQGEVCHIQVEPLKVLKGSPMRKIAAEENYAFSNAPPYKVLRTPTLSFSEICRIETVSRLIDLVFNSGKFPTTLTLVGQSKALSRFFAAAAQYWEDAGQPATLSQTALFESIWIFTEEFLPNGEREEFRDALCYDFCLTDYPSAAGLPGFFAGSSDVRRGNMKEDNTTYKIKLDIPAGSRVRSFRHAFRRDYLSYPWGKGPVALLFVYISAPGRGLRIEVLKV
jgi:anaerobic magnesium-protoporphyrin IX monomethyl ester cyclase